MGEREVVNSGRSWRSGSLMQCSRAGSSQSALLLQTRAATQRPLLERGSRSLRKQLRPAGQSAARSLGAALGWQIRSRTLEPPCASTQEKLAFVWAAVGSQISAQKSCPPRSLAGKQAMGFPVRSVAQVLSVERAS